jgi:hypothetical protein
MFIELFFIFSVRRKAFEFECKQNKHSLGYLGKSILLFIWISLSRIYHNHKYVIKNPIEIYSDIFSFSFLLANLNRYNLFSIMWRRLSLVVEIIYCIRWFSILCICLFNILFLLKSKNLTEKKTSRFALFFL